MVLLTKPCAAPFAPPRWRGVGAFLAGEHVADPAGVEAKRRVTHTGPAFRLSTIAWQCEADEWRRRVLVAHWPGVTCVAGAFESEVEASHPGKQ